MDYHLSSWQQIASETGEEIQTTRRTALALHQYYEGINNFVKQQRLDEWRLTGGTAPS
jgi:hypothetical protein